MDFKDILKNRRSALGKTLEEIGSDVGVSKATVQRWESGEIKNIRRDKIAKLANSLRVSPDYIMGWETDNEVPPGFMPLPKMKKVPLIGTIACGTPILAEENIDGYIETFDDVQCDFCLRCKGDSMINARIHDGDVVFIRKQPDVKNGQIAAVLTGEEATLKRVYKYDDHIVLSAENPSFPPIILFGSQAKNVRIQGVAVAFLGKVE